MALVVLTCALASSASAQTSERFDLGVGLLWVGTAQYPTIDATQMTPGGGSRVVFRTDSALESSVGLAVRIGARLNDVFTAEATLSRNKADLSTRVTADIEGVADTSASEPVIQFLIEGGVRARLRRWQTERLEPFLSGGGGYLRQLNDGQTLVQTGRSWYAGGGVIYGLKSGGTGWLKSSGLRFDARATLLEQGVALDDGRHLVPTFGGAFFVRF